jgi:hypothetical protein
MAPDIPEPPHRPHGGSRLPAWLEWVTAISALVISVCSIGIALYNASIENRILKADSYPYLIYGVSDATIEGRKRITVEFINNGTGPADERSLKVKIGDRYVTDMPDLLRAALGPDEAARAAKVLPDLQSSLPTRFVASKDRALVFQIDQTPQNAREWDLLDRTVTTKGWTLEFCYCSVFEECWAVKNDERARENDVRKPVKACVRDEAHEFRPRKQFNGE